MLIKSGKQPTVKDVAAYAGVSVATVSRTLSRPHEVKEATRKHVLKAVEECGYRVNSLGADLRSGKTNTLMVLVADIINPFYADFFKGIEVYARSQNYAVLIGDTSDSDQKKQIYSNMLASRKTDGILLNSFDIPQLLEGEINRNQKLRQPIVGCEIFDNVKIPTVRIHNELGGQLAAKHLVSLGHKNIVQICGQLRSNALQQRFFGFNQVLEAAGISAARLIHAYDDLTITAGRAAAHEIAKMENRPTAIFAHNDELAIGALHEFNLMGIAVPEQISIIGYDDLSFSSAVTPELTTIHLPRKRWGEKACQRLIDLIEAKNTTIDDQLIKPHLITRSSTCRAP